MRRWLKRIVIVLAAFGLPMAAFYFYAVWQGERELRAVVDELDANEAPWRWDDLLAARTPVAQEDDVRAIVLSVHGQIPRGFGGKLNVQLRPNLLLWSEEAEAYAKELEPLEAALQEARKVAHLSKGRLQVPWSGNLLGADLEDVQSARELNTLLHFDATRQAHHGDLEQGMENCLAMQRTAQALQDELGLLAHLVRIGIQNAGITSLERVLGHGQPSLDQLERLQNAWEGFDRERALMNAFRGERAYSHRLFEAITEGKIAIQNAGVLQPQGDPWQNFVEIYLRTTLKQSHAWTLRHWSAALKSLELPEPERTACHRQLEDDVRKAPGAAKWLMPHWLKIFEAHQRTEARTRCAIAALACERFRRTNERWPQSLAELSPKFLTKVPVDPCTGTPLLLRVTHDGIVIHSVGPDGKLRGAYHDEASPDPRNMSYEFRLWNVSQRRLIDQRQP